MLTQISFSLLGILAVFLSLVMITRKWPVTAAMLLIVIMMLLAGMYGVLGAHFSAVSQIIVYAGAIMVVFIFVIMLLNIPVAELRYGRMTAGEMLLSLVGCVVALFLGTQVGQGKLLSVLNAANISPLARQPFFPESENVKNVSALMFTDYLWAFELTSFLILAAIIGAVIVAKRKKGEHSDAKPS